MSAFDLHLPWRGDLSWDDNGDLLAAVEDELSEHRVVRTLLTNHIVEDPDGNMLLPPDDMFNPEFGAGLGRDIDGPMTDDDNADRAARILVGMSGENTVDQAASPSIRFVNDKLAGKVACLLEYSTLQGQLVQTGFRL